MHQDRFLQQDLKNIKNVSAQNSVFTQNKQRREPVSIHMNFENSMLRSTYERRYCCTYRWEFSFANYCACRSDLLIGLNILKSLWIYMKESFDKHSDVFYWTNWLTTQGLALSTNGENGMLMMAQLNRMEGDMNLSEKSMTLPIVNYYFIRQNRSQFIGPSLLDPIDSGEESDINDSLICMTDTASNNGLNESATE